MNFTREEMSYIITGLSKYKYDLKERLDDAKYDLDYLLKSENCGLRTHEDFNQYVEDDKETISECIEDMNNIEELIRRLKGI